jgi:hypothetical protein
VKIADSDKAMPYIAGCISFCTEVKPFQRATREFHQPLLSVEFFALCLQVIGIVDQTQIQSFVEHRKMRGI